VDTTRKEQAAQLAMALRGEVADLAAAGCRVLQVRLGPAVCCALCVWCLVWCSKTWMGSLASICSLRRHVAAAEQCSTVLVECWVAHISCRSGLSIQYLHFG
jgi:hypothetical protein